MTTPEQRNNARQLLLALLHEPVDRGLLRQLINSGVDWQTVHQLAEYHEVRPLVYHGLRQVAADVPAGTMDHYLTLHAANTLRNLQFASQLRGLLKLFSQAGIPVIPYKGPVLAEEAYGDIALRTFNDLDLLVPEGQAWQSVQLLLGQGYLLDFDLPENRWDALKKTVNQLWLHHPHYQWGVEIHWELFHPMYAMPFDLSGHWAALNGREGRLSVEESLVMLCAHGTKHLWSHLRWLVDVDRLLRSSPGINWQVVDSLAERSSSERSLLLGLSLAGQVLDTSLPAGIRGRIDRDRAVLELTRSAADHLFADQPRRRQFHREFFFFLKSRRRPTDRCKQILRWLFWPRLADWQTFPQGDRCRWLYPILRPFRMVWKWLIQPLLGSSKDASKPGNTPAK